MSRSRKLYLSILLLTGGGFGVDKVFLGGAVSGPSNSSAAEVIAMPSTSKAEKSSSERVPEAPASDLTYLARMLGSVPIDCDSGRRDAFSIPRAWRAPGPASEKITPPPTSAQAAAASMKVTTMMAGKGLIIGGRYHAIGDEWDGIAVVRVSTDEAVIRHIATGTEAMVRIAGADAARREGVRVNVRTDGQAQ
ncbi:MAG: hypothetical protein ACREJO_02325 [Phycisphaerales bacterium]